MRGFIIALSFLFLIGCTGIKQETQEIIITTNDSDGRKLMITPMGGNVEATEMANNEGICSTIIPTSPTGFYNLVSIKGMSQTILPYYIPVTKAKSEESLTFGEKGFVEVKGSDDNQALAAYANVFSHINRMLWSPTVNLSNPDLLKGFISKADSIVNVYDCSDEVEEYLKIWSYINAYDNYASVQHILRLKNDEMPYQRKDFLPNPHTVLDSPLAALFANTPHIVFSNLPNQNNLDSALIYLDAHYTDSTLKAKVKNNIAERYVTRFNYADGFEKGLERLQKATETYGLDPSHAERFAKLKATIPGQPFPENVELKDTNGNVVDFKTFHGKYVYIDLWASWCNPCLKEVPALQKLEKELKNNKVTFLSISIDSKEDAWKNKMKEKEMHGNQLWDPTNSLGQALNVKGIPFFAIYDPDGNLYMHGAPRPSQGPGLVMLLEGLK